jgi:hypothetical protein
LDTVELREFVRLEAQKKLLAGQVKAAGQQATELGVRIVDDLIAEGLPSVKVQVPHTPSLGEDGGKLLGLIDSILSAFVLPEEMQRAAEQVVRDVTNGDGKQRFRVVSIVPDINAGPKDEDAKPDVIAALEASEQTAMFVSKGYNASSLRSFIREIAKEVEEKCKSDGTLFNEDALRAALSPELSAALKISFGHTVKSLSA